MLNYKNFPIGVGDFLLIGRVWKRDRDCGILGQVVAELPLTLPSPAGRGGLCGFPFSRE